MKTAAQPRWCQEWKYRPQSQPRVPGFGRQRLTPRDGYRDHDIPRPIQLSGQISDAVGHHLPWYRVDGRLTNTDRQASLGHRAHAFTACKGNTAARHPPLEADNDFSPMGHVRVITGILDNRCPPRPVRNRGGSHLKAGCFAGWCINRDGLRKFARNHCPVCCIGGGGGTGACGPAKTQICPEGGVHCFLRQTVWTIIRD